MKLIAVILLLTFAYSPITKLKYSEPKEDIFYIEYKNELYQLYFIDASNEKYLHVHTMTGLIIKCDWDDIIAREE